jgi:hypothetical protein
MAANVKKEINEKLLNTKEFTMFIEKQVSQSGCEYLDAIVSYADKHQIEIETVASLVKNSHVLKARLAAESEEANLLKSKKSNKLPI